MHLFTLLLAYAVSLVLGQQDIAECGLTCIANISGTTCDQSDWSCLCQSSSWLEQTDSCARSACNSTEYDATITTIAELCTVISEPVTVQPYATAASSLFDQPFSTLGFSTGSLRPLQGGTVTAVSSGMSSTEASSSEMSSTTHSATTTSGTNSATAATTTSTPSSSPAATSSNQSPHSSISTTTSYILAGLLLMFAWYL